MYVIASMDTAAAQEGQGRPGGAKDDMDMDMDVKMETLEAAKYFQQGIPDPSPLPPAVDFGRLEITLQPAGAASSSDVQRQEQLGEIPVGGGGASQASFVSFDTGSGAVRKGKRTVKPKQGAGEKLKAAAAAAATRKRKSAPAAEGTSETREGEGKPKKRARKSVDAAKAVLSTEKSNDLQSPAEKAVKSRRRVSKVQKVLADEGGGTRNTDETQERDRLPEQEVKVTKKKAAKAKADVGVKKVKAAKEPKAKTGPTTRKKNQPLTRGEPQWTLPKSLHPSGSKTVPPSRDDDQPVLRPSIWCSSKEELVSAMPELSKSINGIVWLLSATPMIILEERTNGIVVSDLVTDGISFEMTMIRDFLCLRDDLHSAADESAMRLRGGASPPIVRPSSIDNGFSGDLRSGQMSIHPYQGDTPWTPSRNVRASFSNSPPTPIPHPSRRPIDQTIRPQHSHFGAPKEHTFSNTFRKPARPSTDPETSSKTPESKGLPGSPHAARSSAGEIRPSKGVPSMVHPSGAYYSPTSHYPVSGPPTHPSPSSSAIYHPRDGRNPSFPRYSEPVPSSHSVAMGTSSIPPSAGSSFSYMIRPSKGVPSMVHPPSGAYYSPTSHYPVSGPHARPSPSSSEIYHPRDGPNPSFPCYSEPVPSSHSVAMGTSSIPPSSGSDFSYTRDSPFFDLDSEPRPTAATCSCTRTNFDRHCRGCGSPGKVQVPPDDLGFGHRRRGSSAEDEDMVVLSPVIMEGNAEEMDRHAAARSLNVHSGFPALAPATSPTFALGAGRNGSLADPVLGLVPSLSSSLPITSTSSLASSLPPPETPALDTSATHRHPVPPSSASASTFESSKNEVEPTLDQCIPCKLPPEIAAVCDAYIAGTPITIITTRAYLAHHWGGRIRVPEECRYVFLGFFKITSVQERRLVPPHITAGLESDHVAGQVEWRFMCSWIPSGEEAGAHPAMSSACALRPWWAPTAPSPLSPSAPSSSAAPTLHPTDASRAHGHDGEEEDTMTTPRYLVRRKQHPNYALRAFPLHLRFYSPLPLALLAPPGNGEVDGDLPSGWLCSDIDTAGCGKLNFQSLMRHRRCESSFCEERKWARAKANGKRKQKQRAPSDDNRGEGTVEGEGYAVSLARLRDPQQAAPMSHPDNAYPAEVVDGTGAVWGDGMQTFTYVWEVQQEGQGQGKEKEKEKEDENGKGRVTHVFTGNAGTLQVEASVLLMEVQMQVPLRRLMCSTNPYFSYVVGTEPAAAKTGAAGRVGEQVPVAWPDVPKCVMRARDVMLARAQVYAEREFTINQLTILGWVTPGTRKGASALECKTNAVLMMVLGCEAVITFVPKAGFRDAESGVGMGVVSALEKAGQLLSFVGDGDVVMGDDTSGDGPLIQGIDEPVERIGDLDPSAMDVEPLAMDAEPLAMDAGPPTIAPVQDKRAKKVPAKDKRSITVTLVHGDVLVLSGDIFEYSIKRTGTSILLMGSTVLNA
ncbi:hypothetical protein D9615_006653 [Tricholomella constricta]|uniref:Uncharacterized protein n=1 Tax=Tricholomella constricta TaxID=117010 RepID=A0A8H5M3J5_9AGAR|nr:hypothetical protein D9615_006653 [Tricholomella constricta]